MKGLLPLFCILVVLFASAGGASADKPLPDEFTIAGYTTSYTFDTLPSGRTKFDLLAQGGAETPVDDAICSAWYGAPCQAVCQGFLGQACGVTGYFGGGTFKFKEKGNVDYDPITQQGSGKGTNQGDLTISMPDGGKAVIRFNGKADLQSVNGNWRVLSSSGSLAKLHGEGRYSGNAGLVFSVTFDGKFH